MYSTLIFKKKKINVNAYSVIIIAYSSYCVLPGSDYICKMAAISGRTCSRMICQVSLKINPRDITCHLVPALTYIHPIVCNRTIIQYLRRNYALCLKLGVWMEIEICCAMRLIYIVLKQATIQLVDHSILWMPSTLTTNTKTWMFFVSSDSCLCPSRWSYVLSRE